MKFFFLQDIFLRFLSAIGIKCKTRDFPNYITRAQDSSTSKIFIIFWLEKYLLRDKLFHLPIQFAEQFLERLKGSCVSKPYHLRAHKYPNAIDYWSIKCICVLSNGLGGIFTAIKLWIILCIFLAMNAFTTSEISCAIRDKIKLTVSLWLAGTLSYTQSCFLQEVSVCYAIDVGILMQIFYSRFIWWLCKRTC